MSNPAKVILEDDDEFEDFPTSVYDAADLQLPQWEDTWEDEDTAVDFAIQLEKQHEDKSAMKM